MQLYERTEERPRQRLAAHKDCSDGHVRPIALPGNAHTWSILILTRSGQHVNLLLQISIDVSNDRVAARKDQADTVRRGLASTAAYWAKPQVFLG